MTRRGEFPITFSPADEIRRSIGTIWAAIILVARDRDLVCIASAIGLALSLAFAMAPSVTSKSLQLFAQALAG